MASSPKVHKGFLKKQARSGIIKSWNTRYFVINNGVIYYYQEKIEHPPYGDVLKVFYVVII